MVSDREWGMHICNFLPHFLIIWVYVISILKCVLLFKPSWTYKAKQTKLWDAAVLVLAWLLHAATKSQHDSLYPSLSPSSLIIWCDSISSLHLPFCYSASLQLLWGAISFACKQQYYDITYISCIEKKDIQAAITLNALSSFRFSFHTKTFFK